MSVLPEGAGSVVKIVTEYSVAGRVAQFGRGVMEDVSRRIVNEMAACIKSNVEAGEPGGDSGGDSGGDGEGAGPGAALNPASASPPATARPINAFSLLFSVLWARLTGRQEERAPMEPLDAGTAGIGALLGLSSLLSLALGAAVVATAIDAISRVS
jgi:hypothetical protein